MLLDWNFAPARVRNPLLFNIEDIQIMAQTVKALNYNRIYSPLLDGLQHGKQIRPPKFIAVFLLHT